MENKPIINPSRLATYNRCHFLYYVKYVLNKGVVGPLPAYLMLGSLFHSASHAYDYRFIGENVSWRDSVKGTLNDIRTAPGYDPRQSQLLDLLEYETAFLMEGGSYVSVDGDKMDTEIAPAGGYIEWRSHVQKSRGWKVESLERRYSHDMGSAYSAPKPDSIIRDSKGKLWVVERKTTQQTQAGFEHKFRTNMQTTLEVMAAEAYYNEEVSGVYILPTTYSRKRSKFWKHDLPQPMHRVEFGDPWPIPKTPAVKSSMELTFNSMAEEIEMRKLSGLWYQNPSSCQVGRGLCELYDLCWGKTQVTDLVDRPDDNLTDALLRMEASE